MNPLNIRSGPAPKWAVLVDDVVVPVPQRQVRVSVIRAQAAVPDGFLLVRDHNSPNDVVLSDDAEIDLAHGNVLYRLPACDVRPRPGCDSPPKLAFFVDDRPEITTNPHQTGRTLKELFSVPPRLPASFCDLESPKDIDIGPNDSAEFADGLVFYTREIQGGLKITVNQRVFGESDGVKAQMTGVDIAALVFPESPRDTVVRWQNHGDREVGLDESITIKGCDVFNVTRGQVIGGFEKTRIERELDLLRASGAKLTLVSTPVQAVVYHDLPVKPGALVSCTDVLVLVPTGYPAAKIDGRARSSGRITSHRPRGRPTAGQRNCAGPHLATD